MSSFSKKDDDDLFGDFIETREPQKNHTIHHAVHSDEDDFGDFQEFGNQPSLPHKCKSQGQSLNSEFNIQAKTIHAKKNAPIAAFSGGPFDF